MSVSVRFADSQGDLPDLEYMFTIAALGFGAAIESERLVVHSSGSVGQEWLLRHQAQGQLRDGESGELRPLPNHLIRHDQLVISSLSGDPGQQFISRLVRALAAIEVHVPFDTVPSWVARSSQRPASLRVASTLYPADRLGLQGANLPNAWSELRGGSAADWEHTMALVRPGLGDRVDNVVLQPDPGGGNVHLAIRFGDVPDPVFAGDLSDGQLSWLAFVAMARLNPGRSLLAVDEPELHLHPHLLGGVVTLLMNIGAPVLLATHADRVLEMLDDPAGAVRVCALDERGCAVAARVDATELPKWLEHYGDFGRLRAAGYLSRVLLPPPLPPTDEAM